MEHTVGYIAGKENDFKECPKCFAINWHENEYCVDCDVPMLNAKWLTEEKAQALLKRYLDDGLSDEITIQTG